MSAANGLCQIGELARRTGTPTTTLRFYERAGLIRPARRSRAGYRLYDGQALERLQFIRAAQAVGFTLEDIRSLLDLDEDSPCKQVRALIKRRLAEIDRKLADLNRVRGTLADALTRCRRSRRGCAVVADLKRKREMRR
ncbi:MAG: heavy metal-responsive transcriptional regulator [Phycisphaerae bacterium]